MEQNEGLHITTKEVLYTKHNYIIAHLWYFLPRRNI
nr:MAG TPA: hypothetical protein [Caudoviricetes sp.]